MAHRSTLPAAHTQTGFSLAEAMLSIVILATSVLGIAATSARVGQVVNSAHVRADATASARAQLVQLHAQPYGSLESGTAVSGQVQMSWTVDATPDAKEITFAYRYELPGRVREDTIVSARLDR